MGRTEPPFLYDGPTHNRFSGISDNFDPKAVTQTSCTPREPRMERKGPFVNFNRHPDSYAVIPNGNDNKKTMSPKTIDRIKYTRIFQLILRILALVGALGLLFCVICIKDTKGEVSWMIRVAPAVAILHTVYGVYHLCGSLTARSPASSASYMLFACVLDAGLIPLYLFIGIIARVEHDSKTYGWGTLFDKEMTTSKIIYAIFVGCCVVGALHLVSLVISFYLAVIFRKISKLPPDMNPLENHLTTRPHKRSKSEIADIGEKHLNTTTADSPNSNRMSLTQEPLINPPRAVPFLHIRSGSVETGVNDPMESAYSAQFHRHSRSDLPSQQMRQYGQFQHTPVAAARTPVRDHVGISSRPQFAVINTPPKSENSRPESPKITTHDPSGMPSLANDNRFVHPSSPCPPLHVDRVSPLPGRLGSPDIHGSEFGVKNWETMEDTYDFNRSGTVVRHRSKDSYSLSSSFYSVNENVYGKEHTENLYVDDQDVDDNLRTNNNYQDSEGQTDVPSPVLHPLEMNPPTPQPDEQQQLNSYSQSSSIRRVALTDMPNSSLNVPGYSTPVKSRALGGSESKYGQHFNDLNGSANGATQNSTGKNSTPGKNRWTLRSGKPSAYKSLHGDDDSDDGKETNPAPRDRDRKGRVVSNSGIDLGSNFGHGSPGYGSYIAGLGVGRRRDVSGKVAEEGRNCAGAVEEKENATKQKGWLLSNSGGGDIKAAGWARFKGL
ncbi:hypothetical protein PABG_05249 [Paracoccidioides brasiliensis Pb03]|nr:hypothetical protein PABG_05249 [Paracoccidioides brasiliensis Pb03]